MVGWSPPLPGTIKINVDRSSLGFLRPAGIGGLIRDSNSDWIMSFRGNAGNVQILVTELKAIHHGLMLAWQKGYKRVFCESDCLEAILLITKEIGEFHIHGAVIAKVRSMLHWIWEVHLVHGA